MFNVFKKKENSFSLDDYSLPNLNSTQSTSGNQTNLSNFSDSELINQTPKFEETSYSSPFNQYNQNNLNDVSSNNDYNKAKIETMEAKISLIDAKISSIDNKLDVIYQILLNEISDETKRKMKLQNMMETLKNK